MNAFDLLTPVQVAKETGFCPPKIRLLIKQGRLPATNTSCGKRPNWVIRRCDMEAFFTPQPVMQQQKQKAASRKRIDSNVAKVF